MSITFFKTRPNLNLGSSLGACNSIAKGMIGCWLFNEGVATTGYNLCLPADKTALTSVSRVTYQYGKVLSYGGSGYTKVAPLATRFWQAQPISVRVIANVTSFNAGGWDPFIAYINVNSYYGWGLYVWNSGVARYIQFTLWTSAGGTVASVSGRTPLVGTWYDIIATDDGTTLSMWVNGVLDNTAASGSAQWTATMYCYTGCDRPDHAAPLNYLTGYLAHAAVWNRCLRGSEVRMLYTNPYCFLYSGSPWVNWGKNLSSQVVVSV